MTREEQKIQDRINDALWEVCQFRSFQYCDIVRSAAERVDDFNDDEEIFQAADNELIYTHQVWAIMEELQTPEEADYHAAVEMFLDDVLSVCAYVAEKIREDEATEEDEEDQ